MHVSFSIKNTTSDSTIQYSINNSVIACKESLKDLGIIMSANLSWNNHYDHIIPMAYKCLGLLRHNFSKHLSFHAKKLLHISLVHSQLTYCSPVWRPYLLKDISQLKKVQRHATKFILSDYSSDYRTRLISLNLLLLMMFLQLSDILLFVKSQFSHFNVKDYVTFCLGNTRSSTFSKLKHTISSSNTVGHFYFNRLPRLWNSLPPIDLKLSLQISSKNVFG